MEYWLGIHKLTEEIGEVLRITGKLGAFPSGEHPSGENLHRELLDELADLEAAIEYFKDTNKLLDHISLYQRYEERRRKKVEQFNLWVLTGVHDGEEG